MEARTAALSAPALVGNSITNSAMLKSAEIRIAICLLFIQEAPSSTGFSEYYDDSSDFCITIYDCYYIRVAFKNIVNPFAEPL
jgi:hypothetical protein